MSNLLLPRPFQSRTLEALKEVPPYHAALTTIGFERRARAVGEVLPVLGQQVAVGLPAQHELSYKDNLEFFSGAGYECSELRAEEFRPWLFEWIHAILEAHDAPEELRVAIDISSMTRLRIASVVEVMAELSSDKPMMVDCLYAPEVYHDPPVPPDATLTIAPVSDHFAGWAVDLEEPVYAVVGLGYEPEKAAGAIEYIEPARTWAYVPIGKDERFAGKVEDANARLWNDAVERDYDYPLDNPFETFARLEARISSLVRRGRPILVPMGPKIFALCALVVGALHGPDVAVWRVSAGELERAVDRQPDGTVFGLQLRSEQKDEPEYA